MMMTTMTRTSPGPSGRPFEPRRASLAMQKTPAVSVGVVNWLVEEGWKGEKKVSCEKKTRTNRSRSPFFPIVERDSEIVFLFASFGCPSTFVGNCAHSSHLVAAASAVRLLVGEGTLHRFRKTRER